MSSYGSYPPYGASPAPPSSEENGGMMSGMMEGLMQTADKFQNTQDILTLLIMVLGMLTPKGRRRRRDTLEPKTDLSKDEAIAKEAFAMMNKLDEEDCIGRLVCGIASRPLTNRTREEDIVLETMKLTSVSAVTWPSVCQSPLGKYQLAIQVGLLSEKMGADEELCGKTFERCKLNPAELMETIRTAAVKTFGDLVQK